MKNVHITETMSHFSFLMMYIVHCITFVCVVSDSFIIAQRDTTFRLLGPTFQRILTSTQTGSTPSPLPPFLPTLVGAHRAPPGRSLCLHHRAAAARRSQGPAQHHRQLRRLPLGCERGRCGADRRGDHEHAVRAVSTHRCFGRPMSTLFFLTNDLFFLFLS